MTTSREPDLLIRQFLEDGINELPDRSYDVVRASIENTRQRVVIGPWRQEQVTRYATYGIAAAAVVMIAVVGIRLLPSNGGLFGPGASATSASTLEPTLAPTIGITAPPATPTAEATTTPAPTLVADPSGQLEAGVRYAAHPFDTLLGMDARGFSFEVPSANWEAAGDPGNTIGLAWNAGDGESAGVGVGFLKVHSLNSDACHWTTDEDIEIGPTAEDLVEALRRSDQFLGRDAVMQDTVPHETAQIWVVMPDTLAEDDVECDETDYRIWNAEGWDIYAQGPSNLWQLSIFDLNGERYVVMGSSMPDSPEEATSELWSILRSVRISQEPGCPRYDHNCN